VSSQEPLDETARFNRLCDRIRRRLDTPPRFPPLTEEQVDAIETHIGFRFPVALRFLYTQVADGGFGPGHGGLPTLAHGRQLWPVASRVTHTGWRFDQETERTLISNSGAYLICLQAPDGWFGLCDIGCGISYELDLYTGRIYEAGASSIPNDVLDEDLLNVVMQQDCVMDVHFHSPSIETLMEEWLDPPLIPKAAPVSRDQCSRCLGLAGPHGMAHVGYGSSGYGEYEDDVEPQQDIKGIMDSSDWLWYQSQSPTETDN